MKRRSQTEKQGLVRDRLPSCREIVEIVTDYLEETTPLEERSRFEQHIIWCEGCRVYLDQMRQSVRLTGMLAEGALAEAERAGLVEAFRNWRR